MKIKVGYRIVGNVKREVHAILAKGRILHKMESHSPECQSVDHIWMAVYMQLEDDHFWNSP